MAASATDTGSSGATACGFAMPALVTDAATGGAVWRDVELPEEERGGMVLSPAQQLGPDMRLRRSAEGYSTDFHYAVPSGGGPPVLILVLQGQLAIVSRSAEGSAERIFGPGEYFVAADVAPAGSSVGGHSATVPVGSGELLAAHIKLHPSRLAEWFPTGVLLT
mmetsp:Transcript_2146/g.5282  ORF Transcript_2146/g.5282 Transcript_2146/m.5282 type:complete len:164 (+) Transcript_2146:171-662(+)